MTLGNSDNSPSNEHFVQWSKKILLLLCAFVGVSRDYDKLSVFVHCILDRNELSSFCAFFRMIL